MKVPRLREPGHLHYVNQRERFNKQVAVNYATLLRFYDVPPAGHPLIAVRLKRRYEAVSPDPSGGRPQQRSGPVRLWEVEESA